MRLRLKSSDLDKYIETLDIEPPSETPKLINNTYLEYALLSLFKIDVANLIKIKAILSKEFRIQPSEIDRMPVWEYEIWLEEINNIVAEQNDEQQKQMSKYHVDETLDAMRPGKMSKTMQSMTPKMPAMPNMNFNMGSMKMSGLK